MMQPELPGIEVSEDQRREDRFPARLSLEMEGIPGVTRDVSATGIYFETDTLREIGPMVRFSMEVHVDGEVRRLQCEGQVVRVEACGDHVGIAARLLSPLLGEEDVVEAAMPVTSD